MTKPSNVVVSTAVPVEAIRPSDANFAKKKPSTPVRNPAFREHEGLRELQKQLNSSRPTVRNNK